jgi:MFS family permease
LSGFLVQHLGWRSAFLFNLPLCLLNLYLVWRLAPSDDARTTRRFDFWGAGMLTLSALGVMLALTQGARWGWGTSHSLGLWGLALLALAAFVVIERRVGSPFVELELFANRHYASAAMVIAAQIFCLFGLLLALPIFLIQVQGWSSQAAGLLVLPLPLTMAATAPLAGRLADVRGSRWTCTAGMGLVALAGLAMLGLQPGSTASVPWWGLAGSLVIMGVGMGLVQSPTATTVTHVVAREKLGVATGIFHMVRFVSGSLGSTVFGLILEANRAGAGIGFQRNLLVLLALSVLTLLVAQRLPGRLTESVEPEVL